MTREELVRDINVCFVLFDLWTESIGLPNDTKKLKDISAKEYRTAIHKFYDTLETELSFREWIESFYGKNEIDFDYIDLMSWEDWVKLYLKIFAKYIEEDIISLDKYGLQNRESK